MGEQITVSNQQSEADILAEKLGRIREAVDAISVTTKGTDLVTNEVSQHTVMAIKAGRIATALDMVGDDPVQLQQLALDPVSPGEGATVLTDEHRQLVVDNMDLVTHIVFQVGAGFPSHVDKEELAAAGTMGLIQAATRFDKENGTDFNRFAAHRIKGAILDHVRGNDWATRSIRRYGRVLGEAEQRLATKNGRSPTYQELASDLDLPIEEIARIKNKEHLGALLSIDHEVAEGEENLTLADMLLDYKNDDPLAQLEARERVALVRDAVTTLPERHRYVVISYFFEEISSREIAEELGVTESRVSQLWAEAAEMIKCALSAQYGEGPSIEEQYGEGSLVAQRRANYVAQVAIKTNWKDRLSEPVQK